MGRQLRHLGTPRLPWRDLWVIVAQSPRTSALARHLHPDEFARDYQAQLAELAADRLMLLMHYVGNLSGVKAHQLPSTIAETQEKLRKLREESRHRRTWSPEEMAAKLGY